ncbi:urease accessory protein UreD [Paenibacillus validus]|uniref:urease accessory protein UreD n=1 Tax=Paenibacillus validus TaxID=44253 RepID=UPI003D280814
MRGTLDLGITANRRNQSFISRMNYTFPLKVLRPFYLDGIGTAYIYLLDTAGGMLAGDSLDYRIRVEDGARLYLTNASASKSYVMNGGGAQVHQFFSVGRQASMEFFPEEVMLFKDTTLETATRIEAERDSVLAFCDMYACGRKHKGERFEFRSMGNLLEIVIDGKLAVWEKYRVDGHRLQSGQPGYLEEYTHWGTLYMYSSETDGAMLQTARECLAGIGEGGVWAGCSLHPSGVLTVKALSAEYEAVKDCFQQVWAQLRPRMLKEALPYIRK